MSRHMRTNFLFTSFCCSQLGRPKSALCEHNLCSKLHFHLNVTYIACCNSNIQLITYTMVTYVTAKSLFISLSIKILWQKFFYWYSSVSCLRLEYEPLSTCIRSTAEYSQGISDDQGFPIFLLFYRIYKTSPPRRPDF
jgi:hypothetical protein